MSQAEDREALRMGIGIFLSARLAPFERTALKRFRGKDRLEYDMISDLIDQLIGCGSSAEIALRAETYFRALPEFARTGRRRDTNADHIAQRIAQYLAEYLTVCGTGAHLKIECR